MKVFVYGTLQRGQPNFQLFDDTKDGCYKSLGVGMTTKKYPLVIASKFNIPFMLPVEGTGNKIKGEVYEVDDRMLEVLDELERHPTFYRREMIPVTSEDGSTVDCGCYLLFNFREDLLKLPFYDTYDSNGSHDLPYVPSSSRDVGKNYNLISSVKNVD
ncbi:putative gamma-glutamylcyclotransferase CG2811 [Mizuhopecten yessoensis]|uniref:Gamma-glutamylcyclotransferase family protein n=1 Tax=Mizuhopecten yessoensis TaxID=6573 RepID=A0A210PFQ3_MIZYE|nr:putative gamma-glutamylcyclotransferase CG2811 [Mizuhopecten yessoensis]OWF35320.1 Gamma-glutamylaminecyclotransferase C [Mizuhopecten yessoensis]